MGDGHVIHNFDMTSTDITMTDLFKE